MPAVTPVTIPDGVPKVMFALLPLHVPPPAASVRNVERPAQTTCVPAIEEGSGSTVTTAVEKQPVGNLYVIVAVPEGPAVTTPLVIPMLAMPGAPLLQVPGVVASLSVVVSPEHTLSVPVIAAGNGLTVITVVVKQVVGKVYVIVAVLVTVAVPVTTPPETDAVDGALLLQLPNGLLSLKMVIDPWHTTIVPVMAFGN